MWNPSSTLGGGWWCKELSSSTHSSQSKWFGPAADFLKRGRASPKAQRGTLQSLANFVMKGQLVSYVNAPLLENSCLPKTPSRPVLSASGVQAQHTETCIYISRRAKWTDTGRRWSNFQIPHFPASSLSLGVNGKLGEGATLLELRGASCLAWLCGGGPRLPVQRGALSISSRPGRLWHG